MEIEYDEESDAAFIWIVARPSSRVIDAEFWPTELQGNIGLLFDDERRLIGVEVLQASDRLPKTALRTSRDRAGTDRNSQAR